MLNVTMFLIQEACPLTNRRLWRTLNSTSTLLLCSRKGRGARTPVGNRPAKHPPRKFSCGRAADPSISSSDPRSFALSRVLSRQFSRYIFQVFIRDELDFYFFYDIRMTVTVCCLLFMVCCLLFVVCCLLFVAYCLLFVVYCLLFVVCCLLFVVCLFFRKIISSLCIANPVFCPV